MGKDEALKELLTLGGASEWIINLNEVIDMLIIAMNAIEGESVKDSLYYVRRMQDFFIEIAKEELQERNE